MLSSIGEVTLVADSVSRSVVYAGSSSVSIIVKNLGKGGVLISKVTYTGGKILFQQQHCTNFVAPSP